jgi:hypothetical protein
LIAFLLPQTQIHFILSYIFGKHYVNFKLLKKYFPFGFYLLLFSCGLQLTSYSGSIYTCTGNRQDSVKTAAGERVQPVYFARRLSAPPPEIDGKLSDECWKDGNWTSNFHQWIPEEGAEPTYQTELNIQYTDKYLYVAIRAFDREPGK